MDQSSSTAVQHVAVDVAADHTITVKPDPVVVKAKNTLVVFNLTTAGYAFPDSGAIVVKVPGADFPYASWTTAAQTAAILDLNGNAGDYAYSVTVVDTATGTSYTLDPVIRNGDPTTGGC